MVWVSGAELALQQVMLWCMVAPNDRPSVKKFLRWSVCRRSCWELLLVVQLLQSKLNEDFMETLVQVLLELHRQKKKRFDYYFFFNLKTSGRTSLSSGSSQG